ncbi:hypothetical protein GCM10027598_58690 [Amycolatopsis oliviviridis]|uniref:HTH luxR-type domain-containing protein n=1 Tax=Amycolatopsis oliviviridis TaxID=1471590 RepID=A0ABQ3LYI0_9PSEU|nr:LuxR family transcriptional regulator [Amycolatopsis oliviviridis]GHH28462.1 hypothetical protein GCM10017790_59340 [Amycolatopsis oliviviridis]
MVENRWSWASTAGTVPERGSFWQVSSASHEECQAEAALSLLEQGVDRAGAVHHAESALADEVCSVRARCQWRALMVLLAAGELVSADAQLRRLENAGEIDVTGMLVLLRAGHARLSGDLAGAGRALRPLVEEAVEPFVHRLAVACLVETLVVGGDVEAADELLGEHDYEQWTADDEAARPLLLAARGTAHLSAGRYREAAADLLRCLELPAADLMGHPAVMRRRVLAALAAKGLGRLRLATTLAEQEEKAALTWGSPAAVGSALYVRAIVDDSERAIGMLTDAIELLEVSRTRVGLAVARYELGTRLAAMGDLIAAKEQFKQARRAALQIGSDKLAEKLESAVGELHHEGEARSLTAQEVKIAELAQSGYTNKQIADKLFLTIRTIEFHLSNVYRKLKITGRRELMSGARKLT